MTANQQISTPPLTKDQNHYIEEVEKDVTWMLEYGYSIAHTRRYMFREYGRVLSDDLRRMILNSAILIASEQRTEIVFR